MILSVLPPAAPVDSWRDLARLVDESTSLEQGRKIHRRVIESGYGDHLFLSNHLLHMYARLESSRDAELLLDRMPRRNALSWNAVIRANAQAGDFPRSLLFFQRMLQDGSLPDAVVFLSLIKAPRTIQEGEIVQEFAEKSGFDRSFVVGTALIGMYGRCGRLDRAKDAFDRIQERGVVSWNALITVYSRGDEKEQSLRVFREMLLQGIAPNAVTIICIASAVAGIAAKITTCGNLIHSCSIDSGLISVTTVANSIINLFGRGGNITRANDIFEKMDRRDVCSWNTMISAFAQNGHSSGALDLYGRMTIRPDGVTFVNVLEACDCPDDLERGESIHRDVRAHGYDSDLIVATALVSMYRRCGRLDRAAEVFAAIQHPGVITLNAIIAAHAQFGRADGSLLHFRQMLQLGIRPSKFTLVAVLGACATSGAAASAGRDLHRWMAECPGDCDPHDILVRNALVNMYAKCGDLDAARGIFDAAPQGNVSTWNAIMAGYAQHGYANMAVRLLYEMQLAGISPDPISFTAALSASSHARQVEDGARIFYAISRDYGLIPSVEHYGAVVDLLGRAGWLEEAEGFLRSMAIAADAAAWMALLGACRIHKDQDRAMRAAEAIVAIDPSHGASYTVLSNVYSAAGRWDEAEEIRRRMSENGARKEPGRSWIEVKNRVHEFAVKDRSHPRTGEIYERLDELRVVLKSEEDYVPDVGSVLHDVEDEHRENLLWHHSEKLALGFGLIGTKEGSKITIIKNLRICEDCHVVMKLTSKNTKREIVVRDCYRFHHFNGGACSCSDCW
ncbi:hypothetical protein SELMODRAFT_114363 [Selaginella moellendorffii]|uniref:DYW domain-containing protein n=1 Tax=Selaginella moellendorffii TaxID=88036 RepID=D8SDE5_SELML|nr:pentatricopeptide repeat-containing protein At4g21065 [Selaginella moellendorffii]EFJ17609.1 hypothetical protein SELMODRAFT_114363 [Selaginella moellendorffii]|eukprot:XP_002981421.1 pentatricopeptide repeat-containing protein At4g21065 [Selaginella moellendorffii]